MVIVVLDYGQGNIKSETENNTKQIDRHFVAAGRTKKFKYPRYSLKNRQ